MQYCDDAEVKCPYRSDEYFCDSIIQDREIKAIVTDELYQKYLQRSMHAAEMRIAKSFHCKTADCPGWCEYDDNVNTFPCPVCGHENCLTCQAIHETMNCRQYQDHLDFEAVQNEDAKKTKEFLDVRTRPVLAGKTLVSRTRVERASAFQHAVEGFRCEEFQAVFKAVRQACCQVM